MTAADHEKQREAFERFRRNTDMTATRTLSVTFTDRDLVCTYVERLERERVALLSEHAAELARAQQQHAEEMETARYVQSCVDARLITAERELARAHNRCGTCGEWSGTTNGCEECSEFMQESGHAEILGELTDERDEARAENERLHVRLAHERQVALEGYEDYQRRINDLQAALDLYRPAAHREMAALAAAQEPPASPTGLHRDPCACGHDHTAGREGTCGSFLCDCREWEPPATEGEVRRG